MTDIKTPTTPSNVIIDLDSSYGSFQNKFRDIFKKSDGLTHLKEVNEKFTPEQFIKFSSVALKSAYDSNRYKAVSYMLGFQKPNEPSLLFKIHIQRLAEDITVDLKRNLFKVILDHFTLDYCSDYLNELKTFPNFSKKHDNIKELELFILDYKLPKNSNTVSKKHKI